MDWENRPIGKITDLDSAVRGFREQGLGTAGAIVDEYGSDQKNLQDLALSVKASPSETAQTLGAVLTDAADAISSNWWRRHWPDLTVFGVAALLVTALVWVPAPPKPATQSKVAQPAEQRVVLLPVNHFPPLGSRKFPLQADLLFSSRQSPPTGAVIQAIIEDATPAAQPTAIRVLLSPNDLAEAAKWIGASDVTVALKNP